MPALDRPTKLRVEEVPLGVNSRVVKFAVYDPARITRDFTAGLAETIVTSRGDEDEELRS